MQIFSQQDFEQNPNLALHASQSGHVLIVENDQPMYVLMSFSDFRCATGMPNNISDLLKMDGADSIDFEPQNLNFIPRAV